MAEPTTTQRRDAAELLKAPPARDLQAVRERRYEIKDILNTTLLSPEARVGYEKLYAETGEILERAAKAAS